MSVGLGWDLIQKENSAADYFVKVLFVFSASVFNKTNFYDISRNSSFIVPHPSRNRIYKNGKLQGTFEDEDKIFDNFDNFGF